MAAPTTAVIKRRVRELSQAGLWGERILGSSAGMLEGADINTRMVKVRLRSKSGRGGGDFFMKLPPRVVACERIR